MREHNPQNTAQSTEIWTVEKQGWLHDLSQQFPHFLHDGEFLEGRIVILPSK
jgi:hypothetical protein